MVLVGSAEAKQKLSAMLVLVRAGEEVVITRHGVPVARLVPMEQEQEPKKESQV